jgi:phage FluMu gp28-like protein
MKTPDISDSWYKPTEAFTDRQLMYVNLVCNTFNMSDQLGRPVPYNPTLYQVEYHANSLNILLEKAKNILWLKSRGISFTHNGIIELIMSGLTFENQMFPVISQREENSKDILNIGWGKIQSANNKALKGQVELRGNGQELRFLETGSIIRAYPSNAASDSIRTQRLIRSMIDEFAFQSRDKELLTAVSHCTQGEIGQMIIGSSPRGRQNEFFNMVQNPVGFKVFNLPVFDPAKFDVAKRPSEQRLLPIAPWIKFKTLDEDWERDKTGFQQEYMCSFLDDSLSLIPYSAIMRCNDNTLINHADVLEKYPEATFSSPNPIVIGTDVAETSDYTAISAFEFIARGSQTLAVQRFLKTIRGVSLPNQTRYLKSVQAYFPTCVKHRIDMTGIGQHMFEEMREEFGAVVEGIDFRSRIKTSEKKVSTKIREVMFTNAANMMQSEPARVRLLENSLQNRHLGALDRAFELAKDPVEGHGDILVAVSLALLPIDYRSRTAAPLMTTFTVEPKKDAAKKDGSPIVLDAEVMGNELKEHYESQTWEQHIEDLRKMNKKGLR